MRSILKNSIYVHCDPNSEHIDRVSNVNRQKLNNAKIYCKVNAVLVD